MACDNQPTPASMDDLPIFLQMFARLFAALTVGAWLQTLAPTKDDCPSEANRPRVVKQMVRPASAQSTKCGEVATPSDPK
jgi:hypothetical protein